MKLIAQLQLKPTKAQAASLRATVERANAACDYISGVAWEHKEFGRLALHKLSYYKTRERFGLSAQVVARCIAKVTDAYALNEKVKRAFKPTGSVAYDDRILTYRLSRGDVNIWTLEGREAIPFVCGSRQHKLLETRQGESDLCLVKGKWYLMATCNVEEPESGDVTGYLGVDMGIVEIATTSDGKSYSGEQVKTVRRRHKAHRARLQKCGTKSAKRHLKKVSRKQLRFVRDVNHCISKELVATAKASDKALAIENLKGIRDRAPGFNREMRWQMGNWAFAQLGAFLAYKAVREGVALVQVDPRNTSRTCSQCGHCEEGNRKTQSHFECLACGFACNADVNAAINISDRAAVNRPIVLRPQRIAGLGSASLTARR